MAKQKYGHDAIVSAVPPKHSLWGTEGMSQSDVEDHQNCIRRISNKNWIPIKPYKFSVESAEMIIANNLCDADCTS